MNWVIDRKSNFLFGLIVMILMIWIYYPQFGSDHFFSIDDSLVIAPMRDIYSISDYVHAFRSGQTYDVQPVRDFVTWLDYVVLHSFGISVFHLTNVLIWLATIMGLKKLVSLKPEEQQTWWLGIVLLVAVNPLYLVSISWLSARKHLLAACLIVWATYEFLAWLKENFLGKRRIIKLSFFYLLAVFAQPIVILWPAFVFMSLYFSKKLDRWKMFTPVLFIMFFNLACNYLYYASELYLNRSYGISKFSDSYNDIFSIRLFAIGRYIFQVFVPYWTSVAVYDLRSWRGLCGIFLFPVGFYISLKMAGRSKAILAYSFFILMLFPVTAKMTQIFGSDTYLIAASFGIYFVTAEVLYPILKNRIIEARVLFLCLFVCFLSISKNRAQAWQDDLSVQAQAYHIEGGISAGEDYISELLKTGDRHESAVTAQKLLQDFPESTIAQGVVTSVIMSDPNFTTQQKIEKIHSLQFFTPIALRGLVSLEFSIQHYKNAEDLSIKILEMEDASRALTANPEGFAAISYLSCINLHELGCEKTEKQIQKIVGSAWQEKKFESQKLILNRD